MSGGKPFKIGRVVGKNQSPTKPCSSGYDESINGHLTGRSAAGQRVTSDSGDTRASRDDPRISTTQLAIDGLIGASTAV